MAKRTKRKNRGFWFKVKVYCFLCGLAFFLYVVNWGIQVWRKPSELLSRTISTSSKSPSQTWREYGETFQEKSTSILTPDFLAALAQAESSGSPLAPTYWKWRWTLDWKRMYSPASSAAGLFQLTDATYKEAKDFCVRGGQVYKQSGERGPCWQNFYYSRLIPSHAIEMTAARLHFHVERLQSVYGRRRAALPELQSLAATIHLCGIGKGEQLVRANYDLEKINRCGDHYLAAYWKKIRRLQSVFKNYQGQS